MNLSPVTTRGAIRGLGGALLLSFVPGVAMAHAGLAPAPHDLWTAWTPAPLVLGGCALSGWLYWRGTRAFARHAGRGRVVASWRRRCYWAGLASLLVALVSPIDPMGSALFSAHMVQHLLLMMVAAPLLVLGDPGLVTLWALPTAVRRRLGAWWMRRRGPRAVWRVVALPGVAWLLHVLALWAWHLPSLYDRALASEPVHVLEHTTFLLTALLFWWTLLKPRGRRLEAGTALMYLFGAALQGTILGAVLALARHAMYAAHFGTTRPWGLTPLEDQQLAGLLMWVPAGVVYLAALVPVALRLLRQPRRQRLRVLTVAGTSARGTP